MAQVAANSFDTGVYADLLPWAQIPNPSSFCVHVPCSITREHGFTKSCGQCRKRQWDAKISLPGGLRRIIRDWMRRSTIQDPANRIGGLSETARDARLETSEIPQCTSLFTKARDAELHPLNDVKLIFNIAYGWKIGGEPRGTELLALTQGNFVQVLPALSISERALSEHMKSQLIEIIGLSAFQELQLIASLPVPVYGGFEWRDVLSKEARRVLRKLEKGKRVALNQFSTEFRAFVLSRLSM